MMKRPLGSSTDSASELARIAMSRYAAGDNAAFSKLYDLLAPKLYGYLLRQTRDPARSEDLLQQTMLQLHCVRARFQPDASVTPWAFAIARRILIDNHRGVRREAVRDDVRPAEEPTTSGATDEVLHTKRVAHAIELQLARLPEAQRTAFELMQRDGLSLREAAQALGTTENAIKLRAHRARTALRAAIDLSEDGVDSVAAGF
jgi:RNA polymerase sigma-70 factor (ECF subfamily)